MAQSLRQVISPDAILIGNTHTLPGLDYELIGQVYDHPGVAARSGYLEDEQLRAPNVAYAVRLFSDLSGKVPIGSVRINATAAGMRFAAGSSAVEQWCDAAIRHGVAGLYFWPIDYPTCDGQYFGAMAGNPDASARGRQRWDAMLEVFRRISGARTFSPPQAAVGIVVPYDGLDLGGWRRVFDTFVALERAQIFAQMISGRAIERDIDALASYQAVIVPGCPFVSDKMIDRLVDFAQGDRKLIVMHPDALRFDTDGNERPAVAEMFRDHVAIGDATQLEEQLQNIQKHAWVYGVRSETVRSLTGETRSPSGPAPEPDINIAHYMYEHSSSAIMPYIQNPTDFPSNETP